MRIILYLFLCLAFAGPGQTCFGRVIYTMDVSNSFFLGSASFQYTAPQFLEEDTLVAAWDLDYCSSTIAECAGVSFFMNSPYESDHHPSIALTLANGTSGYSTLTTEPFRLPARTQISIRFFPRRLRFSPWTRTHRFRSHQASH